VGTYSSPLMCISEIVHTDGLGGFFFRGLGVTMLRETPSYALYFVAYETVKAGGTSLVAAALTSGSLESSTGEVLLGLLPLVGGAAAGVASWVPVYPVDVVKTNLQMASDGGRRESAVQVCRRIWATGGVGAFWDGLGPKLARAVVNHAATFTVFEQALAIYANSRQ